MGAGKSPLTTDEVLGFLDEAGWRVLEATPAPALFMDSEELAYRYHVTDDEIRALSEKVLSGFKTVPDAFIPTPDGFTIARTTIFSPAWPCNLLIFRENSKMAHEDGIQNILENNTRMGFQRGRLP